MEYTEYRGEYYIAGILRIKKTPDGWTLFKRRNMQSNFYESIHGAHYANIDDAFEAAEELLYAKNAVASAN